MEISVSILGIKENLKEKINILNNIEGVSYLHLDIMDGKFVTNTNDDIDLLKTSLVDNKKELDVHLMVEDVREYVDKYKILNPKNITFHYEVKDNIDSIIKYIKDNNINVGLSIKPNTDVSLIKPFLKKIDLVLVMTVEPGYGGQVFMDQTSKINELIKIRNENNYHFKIEVDGGINNETIKKVSNVDISVVGSYITSSDDYEKQINNIIGE